MKDMTNEEQEAYLEKEIMRLEQENERLSQEIREVRYRKVQLRKMHKEFLRQERMDNQE